MAWIQKKKKYFVQTKTNTNMMSYNYEDSGESFKSKENLKHKHSSSNITHSGDRRPGDCDGNQETKQSTPISIPVLYHHPLTHPGAAIVTWTTGIASCWRPQALSADAYSLATPGAMPSAACQD